MWAKQVLCLFHKTWDTENVKTNIRTQGPEIPWAWVALLGHVTSLCLSDMHLGSGTAPCSGIRRGCSPSPGLPTWPSYTRQPRSWWWESCWLFPSQLAFFYLLSSCEIWFPPTHGSSPSPHILLLLRSSNQYFATHLSGCEYIFISNSSFPRGFGGCVCLLCVCVCARAKYGSIQSCLLVLCSQGCGWDSALFFSYCGVRWAEQLEIGQVKYLVGKMWKCESWAGVLLFSPTTPLKSWENYFGSALPSCRHTFHAS